MHLEYQQFVISISFNEIIEFRTNPVFLFRSVLGMNLHRMACISSKAKNCFECNFNKTCAYSVIFESIVDKREDKIPGIEMKSSHPYVLSLKKEILLNKPIKELELVVTVIGKYISYFPYILGAIRNAGDKGISRDREKFEIIDVSVDGDSIYDGENLNMDFPFKTWNFENQGQEKKGNLLIQLKSPLRYKSQGHYVNEPSSLDFFQALFRRMKTLCYFFGESAEEEMKKESIISEITERNLSWVDYEHYSARQKDSMQLGGMTGSFVLTGPLSTMELSLLKGARLFGAGKNTNFGLGQLDYWERMEE